MYVVWVLRYHKVDLGDKKIKTKNNIKTVKLKYNI